MGCHLRQCTQSWANVARVGCIYCGWGICWGSSRKGPWRGGGDLATLAPPCSSRRARRGWGPTPGSMRGPGWAGSPGTTRGCRSAVGWTADAVGSSWEEGRCGGSWSVGWT